MFCNMCGCSVPDEADFCPNCGADLRAYKQMNNIGQQSDETPAEDSGREPDFQESNIPEQISSDSGAPVMMDIPMEEAPDNFDPEGGTTVLTFDMSGPLTSEEKPGMETDGFGDVNQQPVDLNKEPEMSPQQFAPEAAAQQFNPDPAPQPQVQPFIDPDSPRQHQPQAPADKVLTPAPVTGSSILSDSNVAPVTPVVPAQQYQGAGMQPQPQQNPYIPPMGQQGMNNQVNNFQGGIPEEYKPITPWGYIGYSLLFSCIPIGSIILLFVYAFGSGKNINVRNYARGILLMTLIIIVLYVIIFAIMLVAGVGLAGVLSELDFLFH